MANPSDPHAMTPEALQEALEEAAELLAGYGHKTFAANLRALASAQPAPAPQETAAEDAEDLADALAMEARYRARGVEGLRAYPLPTTTETLSDQGGYGAAPSTATTPTAKPNRCIHDVPLSLACATCEQMAREGFGL